ncbi:MAG: hypothetical protein IPK78_19885 [Rhodospirillales bacterium]|nr:hypothetical protein [Rhodospirillales bacterium]
MLLEKFIGLLAIGVVLPALRWQPRVIDGGILTAMPGHEPPALPPPAPLPAAVPQASPESVDPIGKGAAVAAFAYSIHEWIEGNEIHLRHLMRNYHQMRASAHPEWPELSSKKLSQELVKLGCKRSQDDRRKAGGGRLTTMTFPARLRRRAC